MDLNLLKTLVETNTEDDTVHYEAVNNVLRLIRDETRDVNETTVYRAVREAYTVDDWDWDVDE